MFFFMQPNEHILKQKRHLKATRKELCEQANRVNPAKNQFNINALIWRRFSAVDEMQWDRMKVGLGKRLSMLEMFQLQSGIYDEL